MLIRLSLITDSCLLSTSVCDYSSHLHKEMYHELLITHTYSSPWSLWNNSGRRNRQSAKKCIVMTCVVSVGNVTARGMCDDKWQDNDLHKSLCLVIASINFLGATQVFHKYYVFAARRRRYKELVLQFLSNSIPKMFFYCIVVSFLVTQALCNSKAYGETLLLTIWKLFSGLMLSLTHTHLIVSKLSVFSWMLWRAHPHNRVCCSLTVGSHVMSHCPWLFSKCNPCQEFTTIYDINEAQLVHPYVNDDQFQYLIHLRWKTLVITF